MTRLGIGFISIFTTKEEGPIVEDLIRLGVKSYIVKERGFLGLRYIQTFLKILKSEKVDLLHLNTLTPFCKYAGIAGFLRRIPIVWVVRENPLISRSRRLKFWLRLLSSKILFVDKDTREKLLGSEMNGNVEVIYNGVDVDTFRPFESKLLFNMFNIDFNERLIGYVGLITRRKGLEYLVRALSIVKKDYGRSKLIIIGGYKNTDEAYFLEIKNLIKELSLEKDVYFTGVLSDIREALSSLDVVVLPSLEERCSRSLLESLASAKAAIATRVGGTPEIIEHETSGLLVNPRNEEEIAEGILRLLLDNKLRQKIEKNGRLRAEEIFNIKNYINKMRSLYLSLNNPKCNP
ncbi:MAG: glycosyltransferase family 4 protein [Nitrospirota bacterium]